MFFYFPVSMNYVVMCCTLMSPMRESEGRAFILLDPRGGKTYWGNLGGPLTGFNRNDIFDKP